MVHIKGTLERRARTRAERQQAFLEVSKRIVFTEGLAALTMQRLAAEADCAVGTAYTYFPSKSTLVAELQREAIETLESSCQRFLALFDADVAPHESDPAVASLALIVGFGRYWVDTFDTFPEEARLLQLLLSETSPTVSDDDLGRVLPAALELLGHTRVAFASAAEAGALEPGDAMERTVVLAAALNGVLLLGHVARIDPELFDGPRLADSLVRDLLSGWGAGATALATARRRIDALARRGPLAIASPPREGISR
ncbi:MAG: TetR/AcrR family transcriptional regulator [Acidimicrobiales bacterium]